MSFASIDVRVAARDVAARHVVRLTLKPVDGTLLPAWRPGAHIDVMLGDDMVRQYSLCGDPANADRYEIAVLDEAEGRGGSRRLCQEMQVGSTLQIGEPRSLFPLLQSPRYLFIAGGIGITPIVPMIRDAEGAGADWRLLYGGRERGSMAFRDELARYGDRVTFAPQDEVGLLDLDAWLGTVAPDTLIYACGPEALLAAVETKSAHWPEGSLRMERFAPKPVDPTLVNKSFEVELARAGVTLQVPADKSILEVVDEAGIPTLSACGHGTCGTCATTVIDGEPDHRDSLLDESDRREGRIMLICISRSCSDRLVLDL